MCVKPAEKGYNRLLKVIEDQFIEAQKQTQFGGLCVTINC